MREIVTTVTQRGQVTIPAEVRRLLGIAPNDPIAFRIEDGEVRIVPAPFTLETAYRSVPPLASGLSPEEAVRIAREERAGRLLPGIAGE